MHFRGWGWGKMHLAEAHARGDATKRESEVSDIRDRHNFEHTIVGRSCSQLCLQRKRAPCHELVGIIIA